MTYENIERVEVLSVEAWREPEGGWTWNDIRLLPDMNPDDYDRLGTSRKLCRYMRERDLLLEGSKGRVRVETIHGDPEIIEIQDKSTGEPLFALRIHFK